MWQKSLKISGTFIHIFHFVQKKEIELQQKLETFQTQIESHRNQQYSDEPEQRQENDTDQEYRTKEVKQQIGQFLQKAKLPKLTFPITQSNKTPQEIIIEYNQLRKMSINFNIVT